jgi:hypothetical protein
MYPTLPVRSAIYCAEDSVDSFFGVYHGLPLRLALAHRLG